MPGSPRDKNSRQYRYHERYLARQERRYCDEIPENYSLFSHRQLGVYKRWQRYYRKRRAMRELLRGERNSSLISE